MRFMIFLVFIFVYAQLADMQRDARRHAAEAREDARAVVRACRVRP